MTLEGVRAGEIAANLASVRRRLAAALAAADRCDDLVLIAVTKTWPASDLATLVQLGVRDVGENRLQEALPKAQVAGDLLADAGVPPPRWHFVGRLQTNKARAAAAWADVVHSVDRTALLGPLARGAAESGHRLDVLVQVNLDPDPDPDPDRGGAPPAEVPALADAVAAVPDLRLAGVMAVAPLGAPARPAFARLRAVAERLRAAHPDAAVISAGMSGDLEDAVLEGATHVRIGTALLGRRA